MDRVRLFSELGIGCRLLVSACLCLSLLGLRNRLIGVILMSGITLCTTRCITQCYTRCIQCYTLGLYSVLYSLVILSGYYFQLYSHTP